MTHPDIEAAAREIAEALFSPSSYPWDITAAQNAIACLIERWTNDQLAYCNTGVNIVNPSVYEWLRAKARELGIEIAPSPPHETHTA